MPTILAEKEQIKIKTFNYKIRNVTFEGKEHLVVPVIMMTEGVHCGSGGAVYHSIEELGHFPEAWNGIPVCIFHPREGDSFISANSPEVIESQTVGRIFNTHVDGTKLKAECWIDVSKITEISPLAYQYIIEMRPLEVSVGVFTDDEQVDGVWNDESYHLVAHNHRPDHLALLPGGQGACSWADGAGIRANENTKKGDDNLTDNKQKRIEAFLTVFANEGFVERLQKLQAKINTFDGMGVWHFVEEVFEDTFVYFKEDSNNGNERKYFQQSYSITEDGVIVLGEEPTPVQRKTEYIPISTNSKKVEGVMSPMKVKAHVDSLIACGKFTEEDRSVLEGLTEEVLMKIEPVVQKKEEVQSFSKEEAIAVLQESMKSPEQFLSLLPGEMQDQFRSGLKLHQEQKNALIEKICSYNQAYTKDELKVHSMEDLIKLASFIPDAKPDYSLLGVNGFGGNTGEAPLLPVGVIGMSVDKK